MTPTLPDDWYPASYTNISYNYPGIPESSQRNDDVAKPKPQRINVICQDILKDIEMVPLQRCNRFGHQ